MADSDREDVPILEGTRKDQETLLTEVQEIKDKLMLQLDDPAYENLDSRELEDIEVELGAMLKQGHCYKAKLLWKKQRQTLRPQMQRSGRLSNSW